MTGCSERLIINSKIYIYPPGNGYISHLGKWKKSVFKSALGGGYASSHEGSQTLLCSSFLYGCSF